MVIASFLSGETWTASGHARAWTELALSGLGWLGLVGLAFLVLRGCLHHRRHRALGVLDLAARERLRARIGQAESTSEGELAVVVLERSDDHPQARWLAGLCAGLSGWAALGSQGALAPDLALFLVLGALGWLLAAALPGFARVFVPRARRAEVVAEQALQEFARLGLQGTAGRTGVLILVSLWEHEVVVLGDSGIHARVGDPVWSATVGRILAGIRDGSLAGGIDGGIGEVASVLAEHFPRQGAPQNELPDHLIVRHE